MDIYTIKFLLAVYVGNEELALKNAGGKKLADSNDYFVVTDDGICHLFDANGKEKDVSAITALTEDIVSKDIKKMVVYEASSTKMTLQNLLLSFVWIESEFI